MELENEGPDCFQMAMDEIGLSPKEKSLVDNYTHALFLAAFAFTQNTANEGKKSDFNDLIKYADEQFPEAKPLVEKILKKAGELEKGKVR